VAPSSTLPRDRADRQRRGQRGLENGG
jgi:hypothetical protein